MNSGRSSGKQVMSISFSTWLTTPPWSFTPGDFSALMKCSGTFMCSFLSFSTRWKSTCCDLRPVRMHVDRAQQHLLLRAAQLEVRIEAEALVPQVEVQVLVVELDVDRALVAAVDDAGHAAMRRSRRAAGALRFALARADFDCHVLTP